MRISRPRKTLAIAIALCGAAVLVPTLASAHVERASYWPDPAGSVPKVKPLASALTKPKGKTRVVCKGNSLARLRKSIRHAKKVGYKNRPTEKRRHLSKRQARRLLSINRRLKRLCKFHSIQAAVNASGNNDRVVIMPGTYTEPKSRKAPTNDPKCDGLEETNDKGNTGALSYAYQLKCPNDQNLIAVMGRALGSRHRSRSRRSAIATGSRPSAPAFAAISRSRARASAPTMLSSTRATSRRATTAPQTRSRTSSSAPTAPTDSCSARSPSATRRSTESTCSSRRATCSRIQGLLQRGVRRPHLRRGPRRDPRLRGCRKWRLPGSTPARALTPARTSQPPDHFRYNQRITRCDMHHNLLGYSGTDGNAVRIDHNNFYDNAMGLSTDVFTAAGHPGFPQDSDLIENNNFYSNNFNPYLPNSPIEPTEPIPVGTGMWIAGGNNNTIRNNHFYDNWRRGAMLFGVPDSFVCTAPDDPVYGCDPAETNTSFRNEFFGNVMGRTPAGKRKPERQGLLVGQRPGPGQRLLARQQGQATGPPRASSRSRRPCPPTARRRTGPTPSSATPSRPSCCSASATTRPAPGSTPRRSPKSAPPGVVRSPLRGTSVPSVPSRGLRHEAGTSDPEGDSDS